MVMEAVGYSRVIVVIVFEGFCVTEGASFIYSLVRQ
jgi:hypothetical protein